MARSEASVSLAGAEADANALLDESIRDAAHLAPRVAEARARLRDARAHQLTASRLPGRADDHAFWTERALAAEEDLTDLRVEHDRTVPGLAALVVRHDTAVRELADMGSGLGQVDPVSYEFAAEDRRRALSDLECATHPELTPVFGGDEMPADVHARWAHIGMVAAPITNPDESRPTFWRVSCVDVTTGVEVGRITIPAGPGGRDGLDTSAVVAHITSAALAGDRDAAELLTVLPGQAARAA